MNLVLYILLNDPGGDIAGLIGIIVIGIIFFIFNAIGKGVIYSVGKIWQLKNRMELTNDVIARYCAYLNKFTYYKKLSAEDQKKFIVRLAEFMNSKEFVGAEGLEVTEEMKVLISASATQLLFGLDAYCLNFFNLIRIFPGIFYSQLMRVHMKGGTTRGGVIMLSWKDFQEGYRDDADKLNLGLHELAHALKIEAVSGDDFDSNFEEGLARWDIVTKETMEKVGRGEIPFLRKYGGTNAQEFWAVCIEHFFEAPKDFNEQLPELYRFLCALLKQDPLVLHAGSEISENISDEIVLHEFETKITLAPPQNAPQPSFGMELLNGACFVLVVPISCGIYNFWSDALISAGTLFMIVFSFFISGLLIFYRSRKSGVMNIFQYIFQSAVLCGLVGTLLTFIINYETAKEMEPEVYAIAKIKTNYADPDSKINIKNYTVSIEGNAYQEYQKILTFDFDPSNMNELHLEIRRGIFGIRFCNDHFFRKKDDQH